MNPLNVDVSFQLQRQASLRMLHKTRRDMRFPTMCILTSEAFF